MPYGPPPKTGAALLTDAMKAAGWTYRPPQGYAPGMYINTKTNQSQTSAPLPAGWGSIDTPGGPRFVSETGDFSATRPTEPETGPVTETGASGPPTRTSGTGGPSTTLVSTSAGGDGLTEAQLQRRRRGRAQTNLTGGAVGAASIAKKTLVGI